uniref:Uncharacterized protein n=1 Tax=Arundo donax TaxID=35708 RepID=A0A0A9EZI4_ARUDO
MWPICPLSLFISFYCWQKVLLVLVSSIYMPLSL